LTSRSIDKPREKTSLPETGFTHLTRKAVTYLKVKGGKTLV